MRINEILLIESIGSQEESDLNDILASAKAHGITSVPTKTLVNTMLGMGHNINDNSILLLLKNNPYVENATSERVTLKTDDLSAVSNGNEENSDESSIEKLAQQTAEKDIKNKKR